MEASSDQPDLISGLSDSILIHILSFLPSELSGQTCILSGRWRHLWEYVPELIFDDCVDEQLLPFLTHRKSSKVRRFHVSSRFKNVLLDNYTIDQALCFCSTQGVEELHLSFDPIHSIRFSSYYLKAKTLSCWRASLRVLNLHGCDVSCPGKINLPKVEELRLSYVGMDSGAFDHIITGCPSVESFEISYSQIVSLRFHHPNLKRLVLESFHNLEHIDISVPNLKFFKHDGIMESLKTVLMRVENLEEAEIYLHEKWGCNLDDYVWGHHHLFQAVAQAEHLKVHCVGNRDTFGLYHNMNLTYKNVKCLALEGAELAFLPVVPAIIRLLPGLENLDLSLRITPPYYSPERNSSYYLMSDMPEKEQEFCMQLKDNRESIDCLRYSLRRIDVRHFEARDTQIELLKLLVQNASVLEVICFTDSYGSITRLLKSRQILTSCAANKNINFLAQNYINSHLNVRSW